MYQQESVYQTYNDNKYLDHQINAEGLEPNFRLVGDRVPSYGIINFGLIQPNHKKSVKPIDLGIEHDILLRSLYCFNRNSTNEETTIRLFLENSEVLEQKITNSDMPYTFPPGAILNPYLTFQVQPKYEAIQLLLYWQPVHVLSYKQV